MNKFLAICAVAVCMLTVSQLHAVRPGHSGTPTSKIMKHIKAGLVSKVLSGDATDEELQQLHEYARALPHNKPPKGSNKSWRGLTRELLAATRSVIKNGDEESLARLTAASNCKACHTPHKVYPPDPAKTEPAK